MTDITEGFFGVGIAVVIDPSLNDRIELVDKVFYGCLSILSQDVFELLQMQLNFLFLRFDQ